MNNRKTTKRNRVKNRNWREATLRLLQAWLRGWTRASEERLEPGHCRIVITSCVFDFKRIELWLFLSLTVTSNAITESSEKNRRTVQKSVIFTSKQLFCQSQKRSKKGKPFFPSKCFATLGLQKGYSLITDWMAITYLYFSICAFQDQVVTNFWFHNITA